MQMVKFLCILMRFSPPCQKNDIPDDVMRRQIVNFFSNLLRKSISQILPLLPKDIPRCGKVQIANVNSIKGALTSVDGEESERNNSDVRVYRVGTRIRKLCNYKLSFDVVDPGFYPRTLEKNH